MSRDKDRYRENIQARQEKMRRVGGAPPLYLLTDFQTARKVIEHGFTGAGVWSPHAAVTLMDRVPGDGGGAIVSVSVVPGNASAVLSCELAADADESYRRFLVPLNLITDAVLALVEKEERDVGPPRCQDRVGPTMWS